ncbi:MAG: hypothetical protein IAE79_05795 [Anaerolinea sp.]|nr:hypothetical protein [Anaerolinea sp.]
MTGSIIQMRLELSTDALPAIPNRTLTVSRVPHMNTLIRHAWGMPREGLASMDVGRFLLKWKWTHVSDFLYARSIDPVGYQHRAHHHILPGIVNVEHISLVDDEFKRRGLHERYQLVIEIHSMRCMRGEALNALIDAEAKA